MEKSPLARCLGVGNSLGKKIEIFRVQEKEDLQRNLAATLICPILVLQRQTI
jgi:hypothetical protein